MHGEGVLGSGVLTTCPAQTGCRAKVQLSITSF